MSRGFVHDIDPIIATVGGVHLWWYGLVYALGFLFLHAWLLLRRRHLGLGVGDVYTLSLLFTGGVLLGGRIVEVIFYEWAYYGDHPALIPAFWLGGMSTHGLLLGAVAGGAVFCFLRDRSFLEMADELAIPGAFVMGMGRMANFVDGQIVGSLTGVWWAVKFPDAEGFRHPVVLYDGLKNLLLIPALLFIRSRRPARGVVFAAFILGYGLLRFGIDFLREYPARLFGLPPGQWFNLCMGGLGIALLLHCARTSGTDGHRWELPAPARVPDSPGALAAKRLAYTLVIASCLLIPSDWTQDVPARYGKRHPGLEHSALYPPIPAR